MDYYSYNGIPKFKRNLKILPQEWQKKYINRFLPGLQQNIRVLEIGPGRGEFAEECAARKWRYFGIEISKSMLNILKKKNVRTIEHRVPPIPFKDETFDLIHASQIIEHFLNYDKFNLFLKECHRTLKKSGILSIVCPNYLSQGRIFYDWDYTHRLTFTRYNLERALQDYDYEIEKFGYHLRWIFTDKVAFSLFRYPFIWFNKALNFPIIIDACEVFKITKELRLIITKNLLDSLIVIGRKR